MSVSTKIDGSKRHNKLRIVTVRNDILRFNGVKFRYEWRIFWVKLHQPICLRSCWLVYCVVL